MSKTTSLELSKQLREAGFPQDTFLFYCSRRRTDGKEIFWQLDDEISTFYEIETYDLRKEYAAPTAEEILEKLPNQYLIGKDHQGRWFCFNRIGRQEEFGNNGAEAAGKMYLYLKKEGLI